ncbi:MAG: HAMP domain-containing protein [Deltaproteobacteria bacterium]|nr:HAMP domain-containing protein [Deltaproteobacteria bacterium]
MRQLFRWLYLQLFRIRTRLLMVNAIAVLVPVVGIDGARMFEREALNALERDMQHQAQLLRSVIEANVTPAGQPGFDVLRTALTLVAQRTRLRIRLLDGKGKLLADSHQTGPPEGPEPAVPKLWGRDYAPARRHPNRTDSGPLDQRREIRTALKGQLATATRVHQRIQRTYLFVALPVMLKRRVAGVVYVTRSTVPVLQALYRLRTKLFLLLAIALSSTGLLTLLFAATISRPLKRLTDAAKRLAAGDRNVSLRLNRRDRIGELARAVDALVSQLDQRATYIAQFAANISHEFKTPLTAIRGAAELLVDGADDDPNARTRFLNNILADVERLDRLVSRLLELSRIETTLEHRELFDLAAAVDEVVAGFAMRHPIDTRGVLRPLPLHGHRAHLQAALQALVENAVAHSPTEQPIEISLTRSQSQAVLSVRDHGLGVSEGNRGKIFERFFTTRSEAGGTGLGLSLVKTVVEAHGGRVELDSTPGKGATFTCQLPLPPRET